MMKFDMHCHTKEGSMDGKIPLKEYVTTLKSQGYQGMLISDHNSYEAYRYYEREKNDPVFSDFAILRGIEYDTYESGHFLVIMPTGFSHPVLELRGLSLPQLITFVHQHGGILGPAHPFGEKFLSFGRGRLFRKHPEIVSSFDFLEGYNACESREDNLSATNLAKKHHLPCTGGSDSHNLDNVGHAYTEFASSIYSEDDLIAYIKAKKRIRFGGKRYYGTLKQKLGKWNDLLVYSFFFYNKFSAFYRSFKRNKIYTKKRNP